MATRYLTNPQITVVDMSEAGSMIYQEDENEENCKDVKSAGFFINANLVKESTATWAGFYNRKHGAPSIASAEYRISMCCLRIHDTRASQGCFGYPSMRWVYRLIFKRGSWVYAAFCLQSKYSYGGNMIIDCLYMGEGAAQGSVLNLCKNGTYVYYHRILS